MLYYVIILHVILLAEHHLPIQVTEEIAFLFVNSVAWLVCKYMVDWWLTLATEIIAHLVFHNELRVVKLITFNHRDQHGRAL